MTNPNDWVRVRDDRTGHLITVTRRAATDNPHYKISGNSKAVDINGRPLPPKFRARIEPTQEASTPDATKEAS